VGFDGSAAVAAVDDVRHGFTGHAHDDDLGLINMRGRVYSPSTRQFLTPDPLARLGASPYAYVSNNPLNRIDPSGFTEEDPEASWYSGLFGVFGGSTAMAAIDMGPSLVTQMVASVAAMDFPNGNDAPNSSGCPNGTGTAPLSCAAPGEAGCIPYQPEPPTVRQAPPKTFDGVVGRILRLEEPPDEIGPYSLAYHIKHDIVNPTRKWLANEPQVYLDADNNVRASSVHRDYSHEMAPVLGEVVLMVVPGVNALARSESLAPRGVVAGEAGQFAALRGREVVGDALTPHHMPQAALGFTSRAEGGALVMTNAEHALTRTYFGKGAAAARADADLSFRQVLARDIRDVRQIVGPKYDQGLRDLLQYYRTNFPELMIK
jgi:RHS repeat-associated protein